MTTSTKDAARLDNVIQRGYGQLESLLFLLGPEAVLTFIEHYCRKRYPQHKNSKVISEMLCKLLENL